MSRLFHAIFSLFILTILIYLLIFPNITTFYTGYKISEEFSSTGPCVIQIPDPWDPSIREFTEIDESKFTLQCDAAKLQPELSFLDRNGFLHLNHSLINSLDLSITCQFRTYDKLEGNDEILKYSNWVEFNETTEIKHEFIEVKCQRSWFPRITVYSNNHNQIIPKMGASSNTHKPSVIVIVLDSVSHSSFRRNMNKTLQVLQSTYESIIFNGMTKVGDNSFNNAAVFFGGKFSTEFDNEYFDDYPLIWKHFQSNGYRTFYAEDYPQFNLFNYISKGFRNKPVDHYFRPFWLNVYSSYIHRRSKNLCYGNHAMHNLQLNYLSQFLQKYSNSAIFGVSWFTELGHDWLNQVKYGDADLADFLATNFRFLSDSFLIVMSDHGHRFDTIRRTPIGRIEERLPFFSIAPPRRYRHSSQIKRSLQVNSQKLTSFWDLHATFHDILRRFSAATDKPTRGSSLLSPVQDRHCNAASIPPEFCACQPENPINKDTSEVKTLGKKFTDVINRKLQQYTQCALLELSKIHSASIIGKDHERIRITIETSPSSAIFEALFTSNGTLIGDINRINRYGNQSTCVADQFLRKICFCSPKT